MAKKKKRTSKKSATSKTKTAPRATVKDKLSASAQSGEATTFRVYSVDSLLREALTQKRESENLTIRQIIRKAVSDEKTGVPQIVERLHSLGLAHETGPEKVSKVRWELDDDVLSLLRLGAAQSRVAASHLLIGALRNYCRK